MQLKAFTGSAPSTNKNTQTPSSSIVPWQTFCFPCVKMCYRDKNRHVVSKCPTSCGDSKQNSVTLWHIHTRSRHPHPHHCHHPPHPTPPLRAHTNPGPLSPFPCCLSRDQEILLWWPISRSDRDKGQSVMGRQRPSATSPFSGPCVFVFFGHLSELSYTYC